MKKRILKWLFGYDFEEYMYALKHWSDCVDGWGDAINIAQDCCARNDRLLILTDGLVTRYQKILRNAIVAYEFELENQDYETSAELHAVVLNEFGMTEEEYNTVMGVNTNETVD